MTHSTIQRWLRAELALLLCASMAAHAQTRAWLDREQITDSDTVTLLRASSDTRKVGICDESAKGSS